MAPERTLTVLADRYRLEREIGRGGMATVYLAEDLKLGRQVAVKVLENEWSDIAARRFVAEVKITTRLEHPNILTIIDAGTSDGRPWYVVPYVRGESLRQKILREKQLTVEEALVTTEQVAAALDHAHERHIVHRDIKPENILLHEGVAMLADFGIAHLMFTEEAFRLTETGVIVGTPTYMSPEQLSGSEQIDRRSDVFSLATVLYEMLVGEPPFTGVTPQAIIAKLFTSTPVAPRALRDTVPPAVDAAIMRALHKMPADRFASAGEFARALRAPAPRAPNRRRVVVAGAVVVIAAAAFVWRATHPHATRVFTPQLEQLTTDGNARYPSISPDGSRLAYVARDCDERSVCTDRLVVRDINGQGSIDVHRSKGIYSPEWSSDGRFLVTSTVDASGVRTNLVIPALGGPARALPGWGMSVVGRSDTILVSSGWFWSGAPWLRFMSASTGAVYDTLAIPVPGDGHNGYVSPDGRFIALVSRASEGYTIRIMDREGRIADSLPIFPHNWRRVKWAPTSDAIVVQSYLRQGTSSWVMPSAPSPSVLVRYRIGSAGRFVGHPDTLMRLDRGSELSRIEADGSALISQGAIDAVTTTLERQRVGDIAVRTRRLATSTQGLRANISRDGRTIWLQHGSSGGASSRNAFVPFEGGAERPFEIPAGTELSNDWSRPVSDELLLLMRDTAGVRAYSINVASGRGRVIDEKLSANYMTAVPGGGVFLIDASTHSARLVRPGRPDTVVRSVNDPPRAIRSAFEITADGRRFLEFSQSSTADSVWFRFIPLDGSPPAREELMLYNGWNAVFSDGSFEWTYPDSNGVIQWHRFTASGRRVRLGPAPIQDAGALWSASEDGRRIVVVTRTERRDAYVLRNFRELLDR